MEGDIRKSDTTRSDVSSDTIQGRKAENTYSCDIIPSNAH